jgi:small subunit ribosomal protein S20
MAHSKQALKRNRQNQKTRLKNRAQRTQMKGAVEKVVAAPTAADAKKELAAAMKRVDKAAKRRVIHPNAAARIKSRMARAIAKAK